MRVGVRSREQLDESLDFEPSCAQKVDPVAVSEVELDLVCVGPLEPAQLGLRPHELFPDAVHGHAEHVDGRIG